MNRSLFAVVLAFLVMVPLAHAAPADIGVVLLHGKWGAPASMQPLARELASRGYRVSTPEMAWSGRRLYDIDYPAALREVAAQVKELRANGARRVAVAGQSLGANAAVAYAFSGLDLDGLVVLSPGHFPEKGMGGRPVRESFERAKSMLANNRGADAATFGDTNQGSARSIRMSAASYVSFFDPDGLGAMTKTIRKLPRPLPLLLAIGASDPFYGESKAMFDAAPLHPASRYLALEGDHFSLPNLVAAELLKWLDALTW